MKKIAIILFAAFIALLSGCGQAKTVSKQAENVSAQAADATKQNVLTVVAPKSPAIIPVLRMVESNALGENTKIDIQFYSDMEAMMALASEGKYGVIVAPAYTAANLYNKGIHVEIMNLYNWGGMFLSTTDTNCNSWEELNGKELYVPAKGSVPDILTQYFLNKNGLTIGKDIEVVYSTHVEIAQLLSTGTIKYAIDVEPFVTSNKMKVENYKVISDFAEDWSKTQGNDYRMPATCVVANTSYLNENQDIIASFNNELAEAIEWTNNNPTEAGALANKYINANSELIANALPGFRFQYKSSVDAKKDLEQYFNVLLELKPESIGGKLPDENFYYTNE